MIGRLEAIVIDVSDLDRAMAFWGSMLGVTFGQSFEPQFRRVMLESGLNVVLQQVPEPKLAKNRLHLDIEVSDLDVALRKVEGLGGRLVERVDKPGIDAHYVCADPDGNEFCLELP